MFRKIGNCYGGFIVVDEDMATLANLQWARILVKSVGRVLPVTMHVVLGSFSFSFQLLVGSATMFFVSGVEKLQQ